MRSAHPTLTHVFAVALIALAGVALAATGAAAQGSWWPFGGGDGPPRPREPVYRQPPPVTAPGAPQNPWGARTSGPSGSGNGSSICLQLEQRLVSDGQRGNTSREQLPRIEGEIRQLDRAYATYAQRLDNGCYEYFLFSKTLRRTAQCVELSGQVESTKRRLSELDTQRQQILGTRDQRSYQDDIIRELARNNCGNQYIQEARKRDGGGSSLWQDEDNVGRPGGGSWGALPYATYRTICVRLSGNAASPGNPVTASGNWRAPAPETSMVICAPAGAAKRATPNASSAQNRTRMRCMEDMIIRWALICPWGAFSVSGCAAA